MAKKKDLIEIRRTLKTFEENVYARHAELENFKENNPDWLNSQEWKRLRQLHEDALEAQSEYQSNHSEELRLYHEMQFEKKESPIAKLTSSLPFALGLPTLIIAYILHANFGLLHATIFTALVVFAVIIAKIVNR